MGNCFTCIKVPQSQPTKNESPLPNCEPDVIEPRSGLTCGIYQAHHPSLENHVNPNSTNISEKFIKLGVTTNYRDQSPQTGHEVCKLNQKNLFENKINVLFDSYKDSQEDTILADGVERFCKDLHLNPDDFQVLVLAWKLDAEQMCQFTRQEFLKGLSSMGVDSIDGIRSQLPKIMTELQLSKDLFRDLYRFTFRFGLDVASGQRILPTEMAVALWKLVFSTQEPPILDSWIKFLQCYHVGGIPKDTWNMFLNFSESIGSDLETYDDAEAWPSLFDDFVEYESTKKRIYNKF